MNILGLCQGSNLRIFIKLIHLTSNELNLNNIGMFVADYGTFKSQKDLEELSKNFNLVFLKEWESVEME